MSSPNPLILFCQFPLLVPNEKSSYYQVAWVTDPQLNRQIRQIFAKNPSLTLAELSKRFFDEIKQDPSNKIVHNHWRAWLSRFSLKAAHKIRLELNQSPNAPTDTQDFFQELLQIALEPTLDADQFLQNFQLECQQIDQWYLNLKGWSYRKIYGRTVDYIRQQEGMRTFKRTNLGLAVRATKKRVIDTLTESGLAKLKRSEISRYLIDYQLLVSAKEKDIHKALHCCGNLQKVPQLLQLWQALKKVERKSSMMGKSLTLEQLEKLTQLHNTSFNPNLNLSTEQVNQSLQELNGVFGKFSHILQVWQSFKELADLKKAVQGQLNTIVERYYQLSNLGITVQVPEIQEINEMIGASIRRYVDPSTAELDKPRGKEENLSLIDTIPDDSKDIEETLQQEEQNAQFLLLQNILSEYLNHLEPIEKQVAIGLFKNEKTQKEIALQLGLNQTKISRTQTKILAKLIETLQESGYLENATTETLAEVKLILVEWLSQYYKNQ